MKFANIVSAVLGLMLLFGIWGCGRFTSTSQKNTSTNSDVPVDSRSAPAKPAASGADPKSELIAALRNRSTAASYRMEGSNQQADGANTLITAEFQSPNRFHLIRNGQIGGVGSERGEVIVIGSDTWIKNGDKPWKKSPVSIDIAAMMDGGKYFDETDKPSSDEVRYVGTESLNGNVMKVYQFTETNKDEDSGSTTNITGKYWIGVADDRPHKMETEYDDIEGGKTLTTRSSGTFEYDTAVTIDPPM